MLYADKYMFTLFYNWIPNQIIPASNNLIQPAYIIVRILRLIYDSRQNQSWVLNEQLPKKKQLFCGSQTWGGEFPAFMRRWGTPVISWSINCKLVYEPPSLTIVIPPQSLVYQIRNQLKYGFHSHRATAGHPFYFGIFPWKFWTLASGLAFPP